MAIFRNLATWGWMVLSAAPWQAAWAADWPQYRADASRSGYTSESLGQELRLQWSYRLQHAPVPGVGGRAYTQPLPLPFQPPVCHINGGGASLFR